MDQAEGSTGAGSSKFRVAAKMSRASRVAIIATLDGVRYTLVGLLMVLALAYLCLGVLDTLSMSSLRNFWLVAYLLETATAVIQQVASWLHSEWLRSLRPISALILSVSLWMLSMFLNAAFRAFNGRVTRALDLDTAREISSLP